MRDPGTIELVLIRAAGNGEITRDVNAVHVYLWNGSPVDYDCYSKIWFLIDGGYLHADEGPDRSAVEVTADGNLSLLRGALR